jgi:hypothetical protein
MTNGFIRAMNATAVTANGMPALQSSLDSVTDLFFKMGASRGKFQSLVPIINKAVAEDLDKTIRVVLQARDIREGAGERQLFKDTISYLFKVGVLDEASGNRIANMVPVLGRWDDLFAFFSTPSEDHALEMIRVALASRDGLCAKWMPREKNDPTIAKKIMRCMNLTPRVYRKILVNLSSTVETQMCAKKWGDINYEHVPSVASARYQTAFGRNDTDRYTSYLKSLEKGEKKINAAAVYPYDIIKSARNGNAVAANAQWKALPDFLESDDSKTVCVVDVSGSMTNWSFNYQQTMKRSYTPLDVAISIGLYLSERSKGPFKDTFITFSDNPRFQQIKGTLIDRIKGCAHNDWGMSTNLEAVFTLVLNQAVKYNLKAQDMPERIIILSDMQFNQCVKGKGRTAHEMIQHKYKKAGYKTPQLIFWNINAADNVPVAFDEEGTALVSGCSPSIMKAVLKADLANFTPRSIMEKAIMVERYNW